MRFGIVGCGLIGQKRAAAVAKLGQLTTLAVDRSRDRAVDLAAPLGARAATHFHAAVEATDIDAVIVATPHAELSTIAIACLSAGEHVLVEKPGGRNLAEVSTVREAADVAGRVAKIGYNHRFHPAVLRARQIIDCGELGQLMFVRGRYGHDGRMGYEKEWRYERSISGGGGGTDLPSYYRDHGGFLIAAAIDKYVYIMLHKTFQPGYIIKYSELERVERASDIRHPIVRAAIELVGTAMRSPSKPATLRSICFANRSASRTSSFPRTAELHASSSKVTTASPSLRQSSAKRCSTNLEDGLCLFFTGYTRSASAILKDQDDKSKAKDGSVVDDLHYIKGLGRRSQAALLQGDLPRFAELMDEHWHQKKKRSGNMSNSQIDEWYEIAMRNGALGGKLIGAGGGGFLMFYTENKRHLLHAMLEQALEEVRFRFDFEGSKTMIQ